MADDLLVVTGRVETRSQPNANGFVNLKIGNVDRISTKLPDLLAGLDAGIWVKAAYTEAPGTGVDKAGRPFVNRLLVRWEPVETESLQDALTKPGQQAPPEPVKGNWETAEERAARNRSIAMQHAQKVAADLAIWENAEDGRDHVARILAVARLLYAGVQRAWADDFSDGSVPPTEPKGESALDAHFGPKDPQADARAEQVAVWVSAFDGAPDFETATKLGKEMPATFRTAPEVQAAMKRAAERIKGAE